MFILSLGVRYFYSSFYIKERLIADDDLAPIFPEELVANLQCDSLGSNLCNFAVSKSLTGITKFDRQHVSDFGADIKRLSKHVPVFSGVAVFVIIDSDAGENDISDLLVISGHLAVCFPILKSKDHTLFCPAFAYSCLLNGKLIGFGMIYDHDLRSCCELSSDRIFHFDISFAIWMFVFSFDDLMIAGDKVDFYSPYSIKAGAKMLPLRTKTISYQWILCSISIISLPSTQMTGYIEQ